MKELFAAMKVLFAADWGWLPLVGVAIAGFVVFLVNLRTLRKVKLEKEKLALEINRLKRESQSESARIEVATLEDIGKYANQRTPLLNAVFAIGIVILLLSLASGRIPWADLIK